MTSRKLMIGVAISCFLILDVAGGIYLRKLMQINERNKAKATPKLTGKQLVKPAPELGAIR